MVSLRHYCQLLSFTQQGLVEPTFLMLHKKKQISIAFIKILKWIQVVSYPFLSSSNSASPFVIIHCSLLLSSAARFCHCPPPTFVVARRPFLLSFATRFHLCPMPPLLYVASPCAHFSHPSSLLPVANSSHCSQWCMLGEQGRIQRWQLVGDLLRENRCLPHCLPPTVVACHCPLLTVHENDCCGTYRDL